MSKKLRLDVLLVERGLQESRQKAQATIMSGLVFVNGQRSDKPGTPVAEDAAVEVRGAALRYVSRGGLKLEKAMEIWPIELQGAVCMVSFTFPNLIPPFPQATPVQRFYSPALRYLF